MGDLRIIGAGWLGRSLGVRAGVVPCPRRSLCFEDITPGSTVIVASGRSQVSDSLACSLRAELDHLRAVLDACYSAAARRVVVLGSSDVTGLMPRVLGRTPHDPLTAYAKVKVALEDECKIRAETGMPITVARLAPVHGAGKDRSAALIAVARKPVIPLPGGGQHSIGFVLLDDALAAIQWLAENPAPSVVAVGGGYTGLEDLLRHLGAAQAARSRFLPIPIPAGALRKVARVSLPDSVQWLLRLSLPREVAMEVPVPVTPLAEAAAMLVATC